VWSSNTLHPRLRETKALTTSRCSARIQRRSWEVSNSTLSGSSRERSMRATHRCFLVRQANQMCQDAGFRAEARTLATITSCPGSSSCSLIQIEWVPASIATRARGTSVNYFSMAFGMVLNGRDRLLLYLRRGYSNGSRHLQGRYRSSSQPWTICVGLTQ
jgi:hypothetical protein